MYKAHLIFMGILGLFFGSFYGVVIDRLPLKQTIVTGRSKCNFCHRTLYGYELIPVISFLIQKRQCRSCHSKLSWRYPFIEVLTAASFLLCYIRFGTTLQTILSLTLTSVLIIVAFIDLDTMIINDRFNIIIALLGIVNNVVLHRSFYQAFLGTLLISLPLLAIALFTQGMGGGDIKLMAASGCFLGPVNVVIAFILGTIAGGIYSIIALLRKRQHLKSEIPFGPALCFGIFIASLYGTYLADAYLSFFI